MDESARVELTAALNELVPQTPPQLIANVIDAIGMAIAEAVKTHEYDSPHSYTDGSTY